MQANPIQISFNVLRLLIQKSYSASSGTNLVVVRSFFLGKIFKSFQKEHVWVDLRLDMTFKQKREIFCDRAAFCSSLVGYLTIIAHFIILTPNYSTVLNNRHPVITIQDEIMLIEQA